MVIKDFFVNLSIINFFILLGGYFFREGNFGKSKKNIRMKFFLGLFCGILSILCMIYTIKTVHGNTIIDLRVIALMISFYVGGRLSLGVSSVVAVLGRFLIYRVNESSIMASVVIAAIVICFSIVESTKLIKLKKWTVIHIIAMIISALGYYYLLNEYVEVWEIIIKFLLLATLSSFLVFVLIEYVKTMNENYNELKRSSTLDFLTSLSNRRYFDKKLAIYKERSDLNNENLSCIMLDIDYFKRVNDTYGHAVGDKILKQLAVILKENCRGKDLVSRIGGEEFCILLPDCDKECAKEVANRILKECRRFNFNVDNDKYINITISAGISVYPIDAKSTELMLKLADNALYIAKESGRNRVKTA